jgi:hypothetical protein
VAEIEEAEGIVDETAPALAATEEGAVEASEEADELAEAEAETPAGQVVEAEEEAGIVDETGPAVAEAEAAEGDKETNAEGDKGTGKGR